MKDVIFRDGDSWRWFVCPGDMSVVHLEFDEAECWEGGWGLEAFQDVRKRKRFSAEGAEGGCEGYELVLGGVGKEGEKIETG